MAVRADTIPLVEPLAGGSEGSTVVVEPMECGRVHQPPEFFEYEGRRPLGRLRAKTAVSRSHSVPVVAYLLRHPTVGPVLVDTGLHPSVAADPADNMGRGYGRLTKLESGRDVPAQLRAKGISPGEIEVVVMTHLHGDHASAISEFPESTFVVSAAEWQAATTAWPPLWHAYVRRHFDHAFDWRTIDLEGEAVSSYGSFGRSFDLFGDGSVRLAYTPGHTDGHTSVICSLPRRDFVIVGDAAYTWRQLNGGPEPAAVEDRHNWRRSLRELQAYHRAYPHAILAPGHDQAFMDKLEDRYEE